MRNAWLISWLIAQLPCALWQIDNPSDTSTVQLVPLWIYHSVQEERREITEYCHKEKFWLLMSMQNTVSPCATGRLGWKFKHEKNATHTFYWVAGTCLPRHFVESLSFEILKVQLLVALSKSLHWAGGWNYTTSRGFYQPQEFCTSLWSIHFLQKKMLQVSNLICSSPRAFNSS